MKADIFFLITTIAIVVLTVLFVVTLVYLIKVLKNVKAFSNRMLKEGDEILSDIKTTREFLEQKGSAVASTLGVISKVVGRKVRKKRNKNTTSSHEESKVE